MVEAAEAGVILETTPLTEAAMNGTMTTDPLETALAVAMEDLTEVPEAAEDFVEVVGIEEVKEIENEVDHTSVLTDALLCRVMKGVEVIIHHMGTMAEGIYIIATSIGEIIDLRN